MPQAKLHKNCQQCNSRFEAKRFWQKFCSKRCKQDYEKDERAKALELYRTNQKHPASGGDQ